jgi:hypothetical protein
MDLKRTKEATRNLGWFFCAALIGALLGTSGQIAHADDDFQAGLSLGLSFFPQSAGATLGTTGYIAHFQVERKNTVFRPTYGGLIELDSSGSGRLIDVQMLGGFELVGASPYVKPFLGFNAAAGWGNLSNAAGSSNGIVYGAILSAGAELRLSDKDKGMGLRFSSQYRFLMGTIGTVSGTDLSTVMVSAGFVF